MKLYLELAALPSAIRLLTSGFVARLGQGITVFAWIVLLGETLDSFSKAALVAAFLTAGTACSAPFLGRLCDARGARPVILVTVIAYCVAQAALLWAALTSHNVALLCAVALISGIVTPPLSAAVRAGWVQLTQAKSTQHLRHTAMSAESALFEIIFVLGPLIFSGCILAVHAAHNTGAENTTLGPAVALALSIVFTAVGGGWLVSSGILETKSGTATNLLVAGGIGPLRSMAFVGLLAVMAGVAFTFGATPVALAAHSNNVADGASTTGVWIAVWSLGSAVGGLAYGARTFSLHVSWQLVMLLVGLAGGYVAWTTTSGGMFLAVLALSGLVIAPAMAAVANMVADYTVEHQRTEAYTWLGTTTLVFTSIGSAVAGMLIPGTSGFTNTMLTTAGVAAVAALCALPLALTKPPTETQQVDVELQSADCATTNP